MADDKEAGDLALHTLGPIDGRYAAETAPLREYFSEFALMRLRIRVEVEYLIALSREAHLVRHLTASEEEFLRAQPRDFTTRDAQAIKETERRIRHDVKALEYFLRDRFATTSLADVAAWIHWGLTSEDVNLAAQALALRDSRDAILLPALDSLIERLAALAHEYKASAMLARTHGQPAVPTTLGKELAVFVARLQAQRALLREHRFAAKLTGAVGNFNALVAAAPQVDWMDFSTRFIKELGLEPELVTTQLLPYDNWIRYFDSLRLTNGILIDLAQDGWRYIGDGYLVLRLVGAEVGSSTMPQKVNPIDLENAEGNLGISNALLTFYAQKLPVSRLQRDLSDSTVRRSFGIALGHALVAYQNLRRGLERVQADEAKMKADLESHWEVVAEGAQAILRHAGMGEAYEQLKEFTRGKELTREQFQEWIKTLPVDPSVKKRLNDLTPSNYVGLAEKLTERALAEG